MCRISSFNEEIKKLEYASLRQELLQNKSYVFERPLLIIAAVGAAVLHLEGSDLVVLMPPLLIFILLINFWFTANRLKSGARITAYIEVVLESTDDTKWIGWEMSLRLYRILRKNYSSAELRKHINRSAIPDALMFYPPVYYFHVVVVISSIVVYALLFIKNIFSQKKYSFRD